MSNKYELPQLHIAQNRRRAMVVLQHSLGFAVVAMFLATPPERFPLWILVVFIAAMLGQMVLHTTMAIAIRNLAQRPVDQLDELERTWRDQAFVMAFRMVGWALTVSWLYGAVAVLMGWWLPQAEQFWLVLWAIGMMVYGLPTSIIGWRMPDLSE